MKSNDEIIPDEDIEEEDDEGDEEGTGPFPAETNGGIEPFA